MKKSELKKIIKTILKEVKWSVGDKINYNGITWQIDKISSSQARLYALTKSKKGKYISVDLVKLNKTAGKVQETPVGDKPPIEEDFGESTDNKLTELVELLISNIANGIYDAAKMNHKLIQIYDKKYNIDKKDLSQEIKKYLGGNPKSVHDGILDAALGDISQKIAKYRN